MNYPVNFYKVKECPMCQSKDIEIKESYDFLKRLDEWTLVCQNCGYKLTPDRPF